MKWIGRVIPDIRLSESTFAVRHHALRVVLTLLVPIVVAAAAFQERIATLLHEEHAGHEFGGAVMWSMVAGTVICAAAAGAVRSQRGGSITVSLGLLLASTALVHAGGGLTDLHFLFFVVLGLISLYQEWVTLLLSVALVLVHHVVIGLLVPSLVFSDPQALEHPVFFAVLHAVLVFAMCAVQVAYWHFMRRAEVETEETLRRREERYRALVQDSSDVINVIGRDGRIDSVSPAVWTVMGYHPEDLVGTGYYELIHPEDVTAVKTGQRMEVRVRHADETWHWHDVTVRDQTGNPAIGGIVISHRDVTERRAFQDLLEHEAAHDVLTGLLNRGAWMKALDRSLAALSGGRRVAVLFIDLNDFKPINDTYGHDAGDRVLVAVSNALRMSVLGSDGVGRLGGDEFAVVLGDITSMENATSVATRILAALTEPIHVGAATVRCSASIGIAVSVAGCTDTDELLRRADAAMYQAKRAKDTGWALHGDDVEAGV